MMKTIRSVLSSLARSPLKSTLTLLTVGLGVGVLIFALSISSAFSQLFKRQLENEGIVVMVANATINKDTGEMETVRPPEFDGKVLDVLRTGVAGVKAVSPLSGGMGGGMGGGFFNQVVAGSATYRIRSVTTTNDEYAKLMNLQMVAGTFFTADDVKAGAKKVVLSKSLADILFGSADAAVGQVLRPPTPTAVASTTSSTASSGQGAQNAQSGQGGQRSGQTRSFGPEDRHFVMPSFTVSGVFKDVGELQRTSYGVGDLVMPYTGMFPPGMNVEMLQRFMLSNVAIRVKGSSLKTVESQVRATLAQQYGDKVSVQVWEGTPGGQTSTLEEARSTVATFSLVVNLLGFVLLVTGSIGILSIMLVEVLGRSREIALERALGASRRVIMGEYFTRSMLLSALSAVVGLVLSLVFAAPLKQLVLPIFSGVSSTDLGVNVITLWAAGIGVGAALVVGGVFGVFPVIPALRTAISEGMREA
jgi:putative ABC transport system permease protein